MLLLHSVLQKKEVQKANQCFLSVYFLVFQCVCYKMEVFWNSHYTGMRFNFLQSCHYYTLQNVNLDNITNENNKEHNKKWPFIPDHPSIILITDGSGSGKTNALLNLIRQQDDIDKIYLYAKD